MQYFKTILVLSASLIRRFFRDKTALFFTFLFPLLFLLVFGALNKSDNGVSFSVAVINRSDSEFSKQFLKDVEKDKLLEIQKDVTSLDTAKEKMGRGELDSIIELPQNFGAPNEKGVPNGKVIVYYEQGSPQTGQTLASVLQQQMDGINAQLTHHVDPFLVEQKPTKISNISMFDYVFSGLLGFTILSLGIFGLSNGFPSDKKAGSLRRLRATPLRSSQLIIATAINYVIVSLISIAIMLIVGIAMFDFQMRGDYVAFWIFMLFGSISMMGFGLVIGGWAKNENQAAPLANILALPMMFLSGSFFPRFLMPDWLESATRFLPLTPIIDGTRLIMTEGKALTALGPELLIMAAWTIVVYFLAAKLFRWE